jgi:hypothetical protein
VKFRQGIFSVKVKNISPNTFGGRLMLALGTDKKGKVAEKLGVKASSMTLYMKAGTKEGSYPEMDKLIDFARDTKSNLHWLLTGEGELSTDSLNFLAEKERRIVAAIAGEEKKSDEQIVRDLLVEALAGRAAELFTHLNRTGRIMEDERQQLLVLYDLVRTKAA